LKKAAFNELSSDEAQAATDRKKLWQQSTTVGRNGYKLPAVCYSSLVVVVEMKVVRQQP